MTPIQCLGNFRGNTLYIKREDFIPYSFGGNKARKAELFFREIDSGNYDCVVTYGSSSSNHCRVISNMCAERTKECFIISPKESSETTFNSRMIELFGAKIKTVPVNKVHGVIEDTLMELRLQGKNPYFIEGGGHGNIGTEAYVQCYAEIKEQEKESGVHFDYIFFASGTGTTHAGLVCGQLLSNDKRKVIGISIARKNPRGREVVLESVRRYVGEQVPENKIQDATHFIDNYTSGYGKDEKCVIDTIMSVLKNYGIPLDTTYTGKAFTGMQKYLGEERIEGKKILFIHTGGTPLFFDMIERKL